MIQVFKYSFRDMIRNRWIFIYLGFFLLVTFSLLLLNGNAAKVLVSLSNIVLALTPLVGILFGTMYYYSSIDFIKLLLTQPISRRSVFIGLFSGLAVSLCLSTVAGLGIPLLFYGILGSEELGTFILLLAMACVLSIIFGLLAFIIAMRFNNRILGFGLSIFIWLFLLVLYDGIFLLLLYIFRDYPLENLTLALTLFNPVDLARILILLQLDISAMMGYTGAVLQKVLGSQTGTILIGASLACWIGLPFMYMLRLGNRKDF